MFVLRVTIIIALLLFIGSQRSLAIPTQNTGPTLIASTTEETKHYDVPQAAADDEKKEVYRNHYCHCQAESEYIQKEIALTTKMLTDGENFMQNQDLSADETVLVLGKAGVGKTSLVQFLTRNDKLQSKLVRGDTGEYIIEDGEKIGTSATESFTLYPELVNYNSSTTFCDSPGFHDSRSPAHEIVSMDIMKSTISRLKKLKIILLENHSSLQYGIYKDNFINTLRHLNDFLVDIDRYRDNIVLIATKIPFSYRMTDDSSRTPEFITEEMHIESVMNYLNHTEASLSEKIQQTNSKTDKDFYKKVIRLLQSLQTRDENGKATRINVFRRPYMSGPLKDVSLLEKNKGSLINTIMSLDFIEVRENDFDFSLSDKAKMYLECFLKLTSDSYRNNINELSYKLTEYVTQVTQNYTSFHQVWSDLELLYGALKQLSEKLDETKDYNEFFEKIDSFISDQKMLLKINFNLRIHVLEKYERLLLNFFDTSTVFIPSSWTLPIRRVMKLTEEELEWYKTLNKFIGVLSSYEKQKIKTEIASTVFHEGSMSTNGLMTLFMEATGITDPKYFINVPSNTKKQSEVETITRTLLKQSNITCDANGRLKVEGFHVILSEINLDNLMQSHCNNIGVKEIALLAVDTVFLDEDTSGSFRGVNLFIAAPKWKVNGQRKIVLSGHPGPEISDDKTYAANGKDGRPGLPGGNGGSFIGVGLQFFNGENLYIESNGGRGGPGTNGAKGTRGLDGATVRDNFIPVSGEYVKSSFHTFGINTDYLGSSMRHVRKKNFTLAFFDSSSSLLDVRADIKVVKEEGLCGEVGGPGGLGGEAGIGGLAGDQLLLELGESSGTGIKMQNQNGSMGTRGKVGATGDRGEDEMGVICVQVWFRRDSGGRPYWKCESTGSTSPACQKCPQLHQSVENRYTKTGIEQPAPKKFLHLRGYLLEYVYLLIVNSKNTIFNTITIDFPDVVSSPSLSFIKVSQYIEILSFLEITS